MKTEDRLIRAADAEAVIRKWVSNPKDHRGLLAVLNTVPTVLPPAAEPVIRCKDCYYARKLDARERRIFQVGCMVCTCASGAGTVYPEYQIEGRVVWKHEYCRPGQPRNAQEEIEGVTNGR